MDIKKIVIIAAVFLIAIIGYNYYSSAQSEKARADRVAETEALRASNAQAMSTIKKPEPVADVGVELEPMPPEPAKEEMNNNSSDSICESLIEMSENIMRNRLNGVPITNSLEAVNSIKDGTPANDAVSNLAKQIVIEAYEGPSFSTDSYKDEAIREFGARQYLACIKAIK